MNSIPPNDGRAARRPTDRYSLLTLAVWVAIVWAMFYPHPRVLAVGVIATLPLAGLVLCWQYGCCVIRRNATNSPRAVLHFTLLVIPGFVVGARAVGDVRLVDGFALLAPAMIGGLLLTALLAQRRWREMRQARGMVLVLALSMCIYAGGVFALADAGLDAAPPKLFQVKIMKKYEVHTKGTSWHLALAPWGPMVMPCNSIAVSSDFYHAVRTGQIIRVRLYSGRLGLPWYTVSVR